MYMIISINAEKKTKLKFHLKAPSRSFDQPHLPGPLCSWEWPTTKLLPADASRSDVSDRWVLPSQ